MYPVCKDNPRLKCLNANVGRGDFLISTQVMMRLATDWRFTLEGI